MVHASTGPVVQPPFPAETAEGQGVISDLTGDLLFVANHAQLFNAQGGVMPSGAGPFSFDPLGDQTQGSLIVPLPGHPDRYEVIYLHATSYEDWPRAEHLLVDMTLDAGLGDVVPGSRTVFSDSLTEKLTGTPHGNGVDYWVLAHQWDTDKFLAFLVSDAGLDTNAVVSSAGSPHQRIIGLSPLKNNFQGQMKVSMDGSMIATATRGNIPPPPRPGIVQLFRFDDASGVVEYWTTLPDHFYSYGIEFSAQGSRLYVAGVDSVYQYIDQYDLEMDDTTAIQNSRTRVYSFQYGVPADLPNDRPEAMALALDGRICVTRTFANTSWFAVIHEPDSLGLACDLDWNGLDLSPTSLRGSHCNQLKRYHDSPFTASVRPVVQRPALNLWPNPMQDYAWLDGVRVRGMVRVFWCDASGRVVQEEQVHGNGFGVQLAVGGLSDGVYAVEVSQQGERLGVVRAVVRR